MSSRAPSPPASRRRALLWLILAFGAAYFAALGRAPLADPDEGRYAEIPREMAAAGDWVTPRLDGVTYFEKPPLIYWATALCLKAFGPVEWAARAPVALFALAGVGLAGWAGWELYGRLAGLWSAAVLGSAALYFALARILLLDMAVSVLLAAALFCFLLGAREPAGRRRRLLLYGFYLAAALATLAKGLIGFLLPGAVILLWLLLCGQWRRLRPLHLPTGLVLFLAAALPWHLLAAARNPSWAHFYFIYEQFERYATTEQSRLGPWWYFIPVVLLGLFPWTGFLGPALRRALAGGWARRREKAEAWFLVIWAAFIFLFFSASDSKLIPYILPIFPALAVLIGAELAQRGQAPDRAVRRTIRSLTPFIVFAGLCWLLAAAAAIAAWRPGLIRDPAQAAALRPWAGAAAAALGLGGAAVLGQARRPEGKGALGCLLGVTAVFFGLLVAALPQLNRNNTRPLAWAFLAQARPGDRVYHYHDFFPDFPFYAGRTVGLVGYQGELEPFNDDPAAIAGKFIGEAEFRREWAGPGRVFALARRSPSLRKLWGDPSFHYRLIDSAQGYYLFSNR